MATSVFGCLRMTSFIFLKLQLLLRSWCLSLPSHGGLTCQMQEEGAGQSPSPLPEPVSSALSEDSILPLSALSGSASPPRVRRATLAGPQVRAEPWVASGALVRAERVVRTRARRPQLL